MITVEELKKIYLLQRLTDKMIERILPFIEVETFGENEVVFDQGQSAEHFFMLKKGKILLKVDASENVTISLGSIKPGYSFGWSALFVEGAYTSSAVTAEPSELYQVQGEALLRLMEEDHGLGYRVMTGVTRILQNRLERRTGQFLKALAKHIDIEGILS